MKYFFSIIVPIYNVEKYLEKCINSILTQSFSNFELILINDGSTDKSGIICDSFNDDRIKVIHKKNGGLSDARNVGIDLAQGEYYIFIDSDDYIEDINLFSKCYALLEKEKSQMLVFGYTKYYEDSNKKIEKPLLLNEDFILLSMDELLHTDRFILSAWGKCISNICFLNDNLKFKLGILSEDMDWCIRLANSVDSCIVLNNNSYIYRQRAGSITKTPTEKKIIDLEQNIVNSYEYIKKIQSKKKVNELRVFISRFYSMYLINLALMPDNIQRKHIDFAKNNSMILKYSVRKREKFIKLLIGVVGYKFSLMVLKCVIKIRRFI